MGLTEWVIDWKNDCRWKSWTLNITVRLPQSLSGNFHQQESFCSKCYSRSQYSCQRAAFVFVLGQGNKLIGSPPSERGHGWVGEAPHRNLKPYKSAIVWATWSAQGNPNSPFSRVWFRSGGHHSEDGRKEGKDFYFPLSRWRLTRKTTRFLVLRTAKVCVYVFIRVYEQSRLMSCVPIYLCCLCSLLRAVYPHARVWVEEQAWVVKGPV